MQNFMNVPYDPKKFEANLFCESAEMAGIRIARPNSQKSWPLLTFSHKLEHGVYIVLNRAS